MKIAAGQTILFTGDSITDCGRGRPVGENGRLGDGYVSFVDRLLSASYPQTHITILNTGISGNRVIDLEKRWQKDIRRLKPDWLSVMIGINDVWRQFDRPHEPEQVNIERFEDVYRKLLGQTRSELDGLVLMTPYFIETNLDDPMRVQMDAYGKVVRQLATEFDAIFVDVQAAFDAYLLHRASQSLCDDRVHPNATGHMIIAIAFLTAIGFDCLSQRDGAI
jgi:lysophospholipase L1-like esterase